MENKFYKIYLKAIEKDGTYVVDRNHQPLCLPIISDYEIKPSKTNDEFHKKAFEENTIIIEGEPFFEMLGTLRLIK